MGDIVVRGVDLPQGYQGILFICKFCGKVEIRSSYDSYIWFSNKKIKRQQAAKFSNIRKKTRPSREIKDGKSDRPQRKYC